MSRVERVAIGQLPFVFGRWREGADGDRHLFLRNTSQSLPDRERRDGGPLRVVRREHRVMAMPVFARLRDQIGEPLSGGCGLWNAAACGYSSHSRTPDIPCTAATLHPHPDPLPEGEGG